MRKLIKKILIAFLESIEWGYNRRYFYQLDSIEDKNGCVYLNFHVRGKRIEFKTSIDNFAKRKDILNEVHPLEACLIGILSISSRQEIINFVNILYSKYKSEKFPITTVKIDPLLTVSKVFLLQQEEEGTPFYNLYCTKKKAIQVKLKELVLNPFILCGLSSTATFMIGQEAAKIHLAGKL